MLSLEAATAVGLRREGGRNTSAYSSSDSEDSAAFAAARRARAEAVFGAKPNRSSSLSDDMAATAVELFVVCTATSLLGGDVIAAAVVAVDLRFNCAQ
jgi:hypothetical protein